MTSPTSGHAQAVRPLRVTAIGRGHVPPPNDLSRRCRRGRPVTQRTLRDATRAGVVAEALRRGKRAPVRMFGSACPQIQSVQHGESVVTYQEVAGPDKIRGIRVAYLSGELPCLVVDCGTSALPLVNMSPPRFPRVCARRTATFQHRCEGARHHPATAAPPPLHPSVVDTGVTYSSTGPLKTSGASNQATPRSWITRLAAGHLFQLSLMALRRSRAREEKADHIRCYWRGVRGWRGAT